MKTKKDKLKKYIYVILLIFFLSLSIISINLVYLNVENKKLEGQNLDQIKLEIKSLENELNYKKNTTQILLKNYEKYNQTYLMIEEEISNLKQNSQNSDLQNNNLQDQITLKEKEIQALKNDIKSLNLQLN